MGLHLENDEDAGMVLEKLMDKFEIDLSEFSEDEEQKEDEKKKKHP